MRHIVILDDRISLAEYNAWKKEDKAFWKKWLDVDAKYFLHRENFTDYPTYIDDDGDVRPTYNYLQKLTAKHTKKYGKYGADFVLMCVHEDNWKSAPRGKRQLWGTNYSNILHGYHLQYCRWDKDNPANTFGTIYHERHHSFDALLKTELRKNILDYVFVDHWDRDVTHGRHPSWEYIRHKENTAALTAIKPVMKEAFTNRLKLHIDYITGRISIFTIIIRWLKEYLNKTDGVPRH